MRTTLNVSDELIKELESVSEGKSKTQVFTEALEDYIGKKRRERLLSMSGRIAIDYDWQAEEEKELMAVKEEQGEYGKKRSR
ncbi:MAG: type II toxin-antitoxin system VapB family antitoxin [Nitrospira sp.]|nr:type II toxin-antitoxin system VapB family antitoxin [bacterium]MBL7048424.1 type II toxin-antitoxin system VapB family antitoxin [Nitrospira sp.]